MRLSFIFVLGVTASIIALSAGLFSQGERDVSYQAAVYRKAAALVDGIADRFRNALASQRDFSVERLRTARSYAQRLRFLQMRLSEMSAALRRNFVMHSYCPKQSNIALWGQSGSFLAPSKIAGRPRRHSPESPGRSAQSAAAA